MAEEAKHIVTSFEVDLKKLRDMIAGMGGLVERAVADATAALIEHDPDLAASVVAADPKIDVEERKIEQFAVQLLALRQPVADDLRQVVAALKVITDLERIGDYSANIAKRSLVINKLSSQLAMSGLGQMARLVQQNLKTVIDAVGEADPQKAISVWRADQMVDDLYNTIFRELITYMMEDARNITACIHLMFIAKNIERIGDHATNIAETIHFLVNGVPIREARPKGASVILPDATA